jgi:hypothetical protein
LAKSVLSTKVIGQSRDLSQDEQIRDLSQDEPIEWLVEFSRPIDSNLRARLYSLFGEENLRYIPHQSFQIFERRSRLQDAISGMPEVSWAGEMLPHWKVSPVLHDTLTSRIQPRYPMRSMGAGNRRKGSRPIHLAVSITKRRHGIPLAMEWQTKLHELTNGSVRVHAASHKKLIVQMSDSATAIAIPWLAQQRETSWVEPHEVMRTRNKWAKGIIQSGNSSFVPLHDRGLLGSGVVVGIADTGIDHKLCYFHDPERTVPFNRVDQSHRKIVSYKYRYGLGNKIDEEGHGTHTSGSIAGNALAGGEQGRFDGSAPAAKCAMPARRSFVRAASVPCQPRRQGSCS